MSVKGVVRLKHMNTCFGDVVKQGLGAFIIQNNKSLSRQIGLGDLGFKTYIELSIFTLIKGGRWNGVHVQKGGVKTGSMYVQYIQGI